MNALRVPPPTPGEVRAIAALADPVIRNLRITQCYHELACALAERARSRGSRFGMPIK